MRITSAEPARPAERAMKPACRPITSTTITRSWLSAVEWSLSIASVAVWTAVSKPNVETVPPTSLSIVLGTPTTGIPFSNNRCAMRNEPSPPIAMRASMPLVRNAAISSSVRSRSIQLPSGSRSRRRLLNQAQHFPGFSVPPEGLFGEQATPVDLDFEHAARGLDQLDVRVRVGLADFGRQTGGPRLVVSDDTVLDGDAHTGCGRAGWVACKDSRA